MLPCLEQSGHGSLGCLALAYQITQFASNTGVSGERGSAGVYTHACLWVYRPEQWTGGKQQPGGGSVRDGRERCLTFCQEKGVFSSIVQSGHVYSTHLFKKHNLYFLFVIPDILRQ